MTAQEARERFAAARVARLATVGADGRPHVVPITFAVVGDSIFSAVDHKPKRTHALHRLANVRSNQYVSALADEYAERWTALWWARADGRAEVLAPDDDRAVAGVTALVARYPQYVEHRPSGPVLAVTVDRWSGWSSALGVP